MSKKKKETIGKISSMDQFKYESNLMHSDMRLEAKRGCGVWKSKKDYNRKKIKMDFKNDSDYNKIIIFLMILL